jgi:hypothetical protein
LIRFVSREKKKKSFLLKKNHNFFISLPNSKLQMARGVQLDGAQFCFG